MREKPRRRWFQCELRTLLVVVALAAPLMTWAGYSLIWIRERHAVIPWALVPDNSETRAPAGLWIFGERGYAKLYVALAGWPRGWDVARLKELFPEADIVALHD
jgi:hypothetical protein